jgi:hypothetical protein
MVKLSQSIHTELVTTLYLIKLGKVFLLALSEKLAGCLKFLPETFVISN